MGLLDKLKFNLWDDVDAVVDLVKRWTPEGCKSEKDYEKSFYAFLHAELGDEKIVRQYAQGRIRADLVINGKVIVELKTHLMRKDVLQRLIGQISGYEQWSGLVIILLTGDVDPDLRKELERVAEKFEPPFATAADGRRFTIVQKA